MLTSTCWVLIVLRNFKQKMSLHITYTSFRLNLFALYYLHPTTIICRGSTLVSRFSPHQLNPKAAVIEHSDPEFLNVMRPVATKSWKSFIFCISSSGHAYTCVQSRELVSTIFVYFC